MLRKVTLALLATAALGMLASEVVSYASDERRLV